MVKKLASDGFADSHYNPFRQNEIEQKINEIITELEELKENVRKKIG